MASYDTSFAGRLGYYEEKLWNIGHGSIATVREKIKAAIVAWSGLGNPDDLGDVLSIDGEAFEAWCFDFPSMLDYLGRFPDYGNGKVDIFDLTGGLNGAPPCDTLEHLAYYMADKAVKVYQQGTMTPTKARTDFSMPYQSHFKSRSRTPERVSVPFLEGVHPLQEYRQQLIDGLNAEAAYRLAQEYADRGKNVEVLNPEVSVYFKRSLAANGVVLVECETFFECDIGSDTPFSTNPLDPATAYLALKLLEIVIGAVVTVLIAWIVTQAVIDWLKSMTTTTTVIEEWVDTDGDGIPDTKKTTTTTSPDIIGIAGVGTILIVLVVVILLVLGLGGRYKKG